MLGSKFCKAAAPLDGDVTSILVDTILREAIDKGAPLVEETNLSDFNMADIIASTMLFVGLLKIEDDTIVINMKLNACEMLIFLFQLQRTNSYYGALVEHGMAGRLWNFTATF